MNPPPAFIQELFHKKCSFLVNAIMEDKLNRVPTKEELRLNISIESNPEGLCIFKWDGKTIFTGQLRGNNEGHFWGEWDIPQNMINNEFVLKELNNWGPNVDNQI